MQDVYARQGEFNHLNTLKSMASQGGIFDSLSQQQQFATDTIGVANRIAGLAIYNQVNLDTPIIGALPDIDRTGDETINVMSDSPAATFRAAFNPPATSGVAGGGSLPSTSGWDFRTVEARPKIVTMGIDTDFLVDIENRLGHDTVGLDELLELGEQYVDRSLERDNVARGVDAGTTDQYGADDLMVMLDRVVASSDEESSGGDAFDGTVYSDGDLDVYDVDRSATGADASNEGGWFDATTNHGSGSLRQLTRDLINGQIETQIQDSSAEHENLIIVTGRDTARVMSDLRDSQFRADALQTPGREQVNEAETRFGVNFSARISHWDGIPVVVAPSVPGQSLSRIFILDTTPGQVAGEDSEVLPKIGIENYRTPDAWRAGPDQPVNPIATGNVSQEAYWAYYPEVVCRDCRAQGKISEIEE